VRFQFRNFLIPHLYFGSVKAAQKLLQHTNSSYVTNCWLCINSSAHGPGISCPGTPYEWVNSKVELSFICHWEPFANHLSIEVICYLTQAKQDFSAYLWRTLPTLGPLFDRTYKLNSNLHQGYVSLCKSGKDLT
jgi:hypothetical protein